MVEFKTRRIDPDIPLWVGGGGGGGGGCEERGGGGGGSDNPWLYCPSVLHHVNSCRSI